MIKWLNEKLSDCRWKRTGAPNTNLKEKLVLFPGKPDEYLADQLLLPLALAGSGSFRTTKPSLHATTNAGLINRFLPVRIGMQQEGELVRKVAIS